MISVLAATRDLLTVLDPLPYHQRIRRLAAWARSAPDRAEVCADLRGRGSYERQLALLAAAVTRDAEGLRAGIRDPQPSIRATALDAALRTGTPLPEVIALPAMERRRVYRTLRRLSAPDRADALISEVQASFGDGEAAALLPACGPATVRALLPELEPVLAPERLVRRHPGLLLERVTERLAGADAQERARIWSDAAGAVLRCDPAAVLDLLERYAPAERLPGELTAYGIIAAHDPGRVARLLAAPARAAWFGAAHLPRALLRRLAPLPTADLAPLARRLCHHPRNLAALLAAVPPARRTELYEAALTEVDTAGWDPAHEVVGVLPAAARIAAVTRLLSRDKIRTEPEILTWSSYLGWPEAAAALESGLRSGDAEDRAMAYRLLVLAAHRSRAPRVVAELVDRLGRLRNEQDPVRAAALGATVRLARLLTAGSAPALTRLTTDAVDARDTSATTTGALVRLATATLQHHVDEPELREWALLTIDLVSTGANVPTLRRFDLVLRRGQETMVFARLRGWIEAAMARGRYAPLFAVAHALRKRAWQVPELQNLLGRAAGAGTLPWVAREAIGLWLDDPRGRSERVAAVLAADASTVTLPAVWSTISEVRTDLLDQVLDRAPSGRFVETGLRWVPTRAERAERWLPRQRATFVALQERIIADTGMEIWRRAAAINAAARVPDAGRELVLRHVDDPAVVLAEAALGALAWTDRPDEALPVLLGYAGGDRARVALYAAGRAARYVAPALLPGLLGPIVTGGAGPEAGAAGIEAGAAGGRTGAIGAGAAKVTSRKEAARLLARFGAAGVMVLLLRAYSDPGAHRDVRAAIASAARQRLGDPESWAILEAAVTGSREERRAVLAAGPYGIAGSFRPRYADLIMAACQATDREVSRAAFDQLPEWTPWSTDVGALITDRLTDLTDTVPDHQAGRLAAALDTPALIRTLDLLADLEAADEPPGDRAVDRPARRRIEAIADGAADWAETAPTDADRSALLAAGRRLATRPELAGTGIAMLTALGRLENLDEIADLCANRPILAFRAQQHIGRAWHRTALEPDTLCALATQLGERGDFAGGLLAATLATYGGVHGWSQPWRTLVTGLRHHPDIDVREQAYACDMST
jgi:hypothetical protein